MINPKKLMKLVTGQCQHPREERGLTEEGKHICLSCGEEVSAPTTEFRKLLRMNKHLRLRTGYATDGDGERMTKDPTFNVGIRYVVPGTPQAVRRVWITFEDKKSQKSFAKQMDHRLRYCTDDEGYNAVINEAVDIIRSTNPSVPEQVVERGDEDNEA